eukprot:m51a1_g1432 putative acetaldehyde dehydrogenase (941) ;mRNA; r:83890-86941
MPPHALAELLLTLVARAQADAATTKVDEAAEATKVLDGILERVVAAQKVYAKFTQEQVDTIFEAVATAACMQRIQLAQMAFEDTGMGVMEDKVIKNQFASEFIYNKYRYERTCGLIHEDAANGFSQYAEPLGVIAGIIPTTNPTSTTIFKCLLALKTRNAIVVSPHPRAQRCTAAAAKICHDAAVQAGAPENIIAWIENPARALSTALMSHKRVNLILATGGPGMVKAAHMSGNPAIGVGPGNCPALIDETADIPMAVASIIMSKTFDNGMICASEQTVIAHDRVYDQVKREFMSRGCHFVTPEEKAKLDQVLLVNGLPNAKLVGQKAATIVSLAGLKDTIPADTPVLLAEISEVGPQEPWSLEKLCPTLGMLRASSFEAGVDLALRCAQHGLGHTASLFTHPQNSDRIAHLSGVMPCSRILTNCPSAHGGIGDIYNFVMAPSLTLGCGSWGGNSVSENIGPKHLLNIKTVAERRENMLWMQLPPRIYFKYGCLGAALTSELRNKKRALVVTDLALFNLGFSVKVTGPLSKLGVLCETFYDAEAEPSLDTVHRGLERMRLFKPDVIVGLGGGSSMDTAKFMWLFYEFPEYESKVDQLTARFIRKRILSLPRPATKKCQLVCIPTTSGTGSEVTPFAIVADKRSNTRCSIMDYALVPDIAISDPELTLTVPRSLVASCGFDVLSHAVEAFTSTFSTPFTAGYCMQAIDMVFAFLERSYANGGKDQEAREAVHYASTLAGIAYGNSFLGLCHSCSHKLCGRYHIPHGTANALVLSYVIYYNSTDAPTKFVPFPQYQYPMAKERYCQIAHLLHLGDDKTADGRVMALIGAIEELKARVGIPASIRDYGVDEAEFLADVDQLALQAFDDQCTGTNPRYPLVSEIKAVLLDAYYGTLAPAVPSCKLGGIAAGSHITRELSKISAGQHQHSAAVFPSVSPLPVPVM